ncbi:hypothetical protein [Aeromonas hydrophila]|uniref:hypothetical protein n=1 Tax=Aeromonas hydrophila TaxID=644 RepID=UPI003EC700DE
MLFFVHFQMSALARLPMRTNTMALSKNRSSSNLGILIFSGYNPRALIAFIRTLIATDIKFSIVADSEEDFILSTDYKGYVAAIRSVKSLDKDDLKRCITISRTMLECETMVVAPSSEFLNRYLLNEATFFENLGVTIPLVDLSLYEMISDKKSFGQICSEHGLRVPCEILNPEEKNIPFVAKPIKYQSKLGEIHSPIIIKNKYDLECFLARADCNDFYFQEYLSGDTYYLLYYFDRSGIVEKLSMRNLIQQPDGKSVIASVLSDVHTSSISDSYEKLLSGMNFFGLVMIELKKYKNKYYMIEANPRFWGPSQLFVDAQYNLFISFLNDWLGVSYSVKTGVFNQTAKYFWMGGFMENISSSPCACYVEDTDAVAILGGLGAFISNDIYMRSDTIQIGLKYWK